MNATPLLTRLALVGLLCMPALTALGAPNAQAFLPPEAAVKDALLASPGIQSARADKEAMNLRANTLRTGTAEFTLRANLQERRVASSHERFDETSFALERPLRWWGKSSVDGQLSDKTVALAEVEFNDAMHEASRELMKLWFAHAHAGLGLLQVHMQVASAEQIYKLAQVRFKQGEIARMDLELSQAEVQRAQASQQLAQADLNSAATALQRRYPALTLPAGPMHITPSGTGDFTQSQDELKQLFLTQNHELNTLRLQAQRLQLWAERARLDRLADPTVGIYTARDRGGAEQITGLTFSMPLSGAVRRDHAQATLADAQSAADKVRRLELQLSAAFDQLWIQFHSKRAAASQLQSAADTQARAAEKSRKAYALGEHSMSEMLLIARAAQEHQFAASRMQLESIERMAELQLELHQVWDFDL
jgi:cobalt-zinc-cadmium efflux system outer membrane protein